MARRKPKTYGGWNTGAHPTGTGSTAAGPSGAGLAQRTRPVDTERVALPFLLVVVEFGVAEIAHLAWGEFPAVFWACLLMTLSTCGLSALTWHQAHNRSPIAVGLLTAYPFVAGTWLTVATFVGPFTRPTFDIGVWLGATLAGAWLATHGVHAASSERGSSVSKAVRGALDAVGLAEVAATVTEQTGPRVKTELTVPPDMTVDEVSKRLAHIESAGELPRGMSRVIPDPDNASRAELVMLTENVLKTSTPWPGPIQSGLSIAAAPIVCGVYEDAQHALVNFYSPAGANHLLIVGTSGAGKSMFAQGCLASLLHMTDVVPWAVDVSKGEQTLGDALHGIDWAVTTVDGDTAAAQLRALEMFEALNRSIAARASFLGRHGMDNWEPRAFTEFGMPFVVAWVEEAPDVVTLDDDVVTTMARTARSAGVSLVFSAQRGTTDMLPSTAKRMFSMAMCFGTEGDREVTYVLKSELTDNGAQPSVWGRSLPGMAYLQAPDIPLQRALTPLRSYQMSRGDRHTRGDLAAAADYRAAHPVPVDQVTAAAAGPAYANRTQPRAAAPTAMTAGADPSAPAADPLTRELNEVTVMRKRLLADIDDPDPDLEVPDDFDGDDTPAIPLPRPTSRDTKQELVAQGEPILDDYLESLAGGGQAYTRAQIVDAVHPHLQGLSRSWVFKQLNLAIRADRLVVVESPDIANAGKDFYRARSRQSA